MNQFSDRFFTLLLAATALIVIIGVWILALTEAESTVQVGVALLSTLGALILASLVAIRIKTER